MGRYSQHFFSSFFINNFILPSVLSAHSAHYVTWKNVVNADANNELRHGH